MRDPKPLAEDGATDFERRLLSSARTEEPPPEVVRRLERALGLTAGAAIAAPAVVLSVASSARTALSAKGGVAAVPMALKAAGLVGLALAGAVGVSLWLARPLPAPVRHHLTAPVVPAAPLAAPPAAVAPPAIATGEQADEARPGAGAALARSGDALRGEILLVDGARTALATGAPARALHLVRRYVARYPRGALAPEAQALRIEALAASGQRSRARSLARAFIAANPNSPLTERIARLREIEHIR